LYDRLGLRRYPPLQEIVMLSSATSDSGPLSRKLLSNIYATTFGSKYSDYNPAGFRDIPFIPAESKDGTRLANLGEVRGFFPHYVFQLIYHLQVFLGAEWKALGFSVIQDSYRKFPITELGVQQHPPTSALIRLLETTPPHKDETARQWFESYYCIECTRSARHSQQGFRLFEGPTY
jgi:hypothetical protein